MAVVDPTAGDGLAAALAQGDVPLDRQLQAGGAPASRGSAGMWLLFGALGFLVGQVLGAIFAVVAAAADGKLHNLNAIAKRLDREVEDLDAFLGRFVMDLGSALAGANVFR